MVFLINSGNRKKPTLAYILRLYSLQSLSATWEKNRWKQKTLKQPHSQKLFLFFSFLYFSFLTFSQTSFCVIAGNIIGAMCCGYLSSRVHGAEREAKCSCFVYLLHILQVSKYSSLSFFLFINGRIWLRIFNRQLGGFNFVSFTGQDYQL